MSRHRNVRSMNYSDEYDGYDDVYGHSVEDDSCISPSDAAFMYDRSNRQTQISAFITEEDDIEEVDESTEAEFERRHSDSFRYPQLSDVDEARLRSCLDEIHSVIGDSIPENIVVETVLEKNFDLAQALDALLKSPSRNQSEEPKPQRERVRRPRPVEKGPEDVLSLGTNYSNSVNSCPYDPLKANGDIAVEVASKYVGKLGKPYNSQGPAKSANYSSDDDSGTESSSMSLVALAAKHKNNKSLLSDKKSTLGTKYDIPSMNRGRHSSDSSSENEGLSLFGLMKKTQGAYADIKTENKKSNCAPSTNTFSGEKTIDLKIGEVYYSEKETVNHRVNEITTKFVAAKFVFSDDSNSDEDADSSLVGLSKKTAKNVNLEGSGSSDDVRIFNHSIKGVYKLANSSRQHTKSESDRFSCGMVHASENLLKKSLENNVSTSLRSLKGDGSQDMGLKFSPGGSIPGSFKSLNASNSLNSSLASVNFEKSSKGIGSYSNISNAYSDSDISVDSCHFENAKQFEDGRGSGITSNFLQPNFEHRSNSFSADVVDTGINLSCALRKSTSARTNENMMSENSMEMLVDGEDEEIVTLLDSMMVDEATAEEEKVKKSLLSVNDLDESCMIDISNILKVRVKLRTRKCSSFGKVVCRRWRLLGTPRIMKEKQETRVVPFDFVEPSPDDVVAFAFKRRP